MLETETEYMLQKKECEWMRRRIVCLLRDRSELIDDLFEDVLNEMIETSYGTSS